MADKRPMPEPIIVDVQGVGPVEFPAGTTGAQIESWVLNHLKAQRPAQTWGEWGGNMAARVGGGIAGGVIGSLAGPVGTFAGTATGAAMGDEWAQSREVAQGVREAVNPLEMLAAGATAPIPGATLKRGAPLLRQVPRALAAGVPGAAASSVGMQMAESGTVDPWRTAMETGRGAVLGGVTGLGVEGGLRGAQSKAAQKLIRDETGAIRVYHGSPHDFDQFSTEKIGTGEGAQAYGHGLYFAETEAVAKDYRKTLSERVDAFDPDLGYGVKEPRSGDIKWFANEKDAKEYAIDTGRTYEVNIDADPEQFLDWDTPLSAQPKVLETLRAHDLADDTHVFTPEGAKPIVEVTGDDLYRAYSSARGAAVTSRAARRVGVPGIKYADAGSRARRSAWGADEGTSNYVVFDDKKVSILRKYGLLPFVPLSQVGRPQSDERKK